MAWLVTSYDDRGRNGRPAQVPRPSGLWLTYSDLWEGHGVTRGLLDKRIQLGSVHYYVQDGVTLYRWEDLVDHLADLVEQVLIGDAEELAGEEGIG